MGGEWFIVMAAILFGASNIVAKFAVQELPPLQVVWTRFLLPALALIWAGRRGWFSLKSERPGMLFLRSLTAGCGVMCGFTAVKLTTFANFSVLTYTNPIFGALLSTWIFREPFRPRHAIVLAVTFLGVVLVVQPGWREVNAGDALALLAGVLFGASLALVREAGKTENIWMLTLTFYGMAALLTTPSVLRHAEPYTPWGALLIGVNILLGTAAQLLETRGYQRTTVTVGGTLSYLTVVLSIGAGAWLFQEPLTPSYILGAALIVGGGVYLLWAQSDKADTNDPDGHSNIQ